ncbi:MAG: 4-hydroxythreonine-4-phosphate dehydrogenase PdxA [Bdellovibrionaceae bacterium]|nr:4-hydroxythreonine-4-phosphate dehydrogenase PdxA [Pseudobdellovibrionaceae bacterium]
MRLIAITTGDTDGIGLEITAKALCQIGPQKGFQFCIYKHLKPAFPLLKKLSRTFRVTRFGNLSEIPILPSHHDLLVLERADPPPFWVIEASKHCLRRTFSGLVTAPMSKTLIKSSGLNDRGHTDILKRICGKSSVHMGFIGDHFNVVLATDHVPLRKAPIQLTKEVLLSAASCAKKLKELTRSKGPIIWLGLNPHAGESGLLGNEELFLKKHLPRYVMGPVSSDTAFLDHRRQPGTTFIASYHDQGLIPFKMAHGRGSGVHITLGLPFLRTSVDHGTAKDIFGLGVADPRPMMRAIQLTIKLCKEGYRV